jgi:hypothetical protein
MSRQRRGRPVAGTSAKRNRALRRERRADADGTRHGGIEAPGELAAPEDLEVLARQHRQEATRGR